MHGSVHLDATCKARGSQRNVFLYSSMLYCPNVGCLLLNLKFVTWAKYAGWPYFKSSWDLLKSLMLGLQACAVETGFLHDY